MAFNRLATNCTEKNMTGKKNLQKIAKTYGTYRAQHSIHPRFIPVPTE